MASETDAQDKESRGRGSKQMSSETSRSRQSQQHPHCTSQHRTSHDSPERLIQSTADNQKSNDNKDKNTDSSDKKINCGSDGNTNHEKVTNGCDVKIDNDSEEEVDPLSMDLYDRLCMENREGENIDNKKKGQMKDIDTKDKEEVKNTDDDDEGEGDPLRVDLYDKLRMENRKGKSIDKDKEEGKNIDNTEKGEGKDIGNKEKGEGDGDVDPLSLDLYDRLCVENGVEGAEVLQWDRYLVGEDLQKVCKKLSCSERQFHGISINYVNVMKSEYGCLHGEVLKKLPYTQSSHPDVLVVSLCAILMSIFMVVTFAMVLGLFILQAQMSMNSREMVTKVQAPKKEIPQGMYTLYFDYLESGVLPENVDLRANTSIFVH